jgi:hypothetical protein
MTPLNLKYSIIQIIQVYIYIYSNDGSPLYHGQMILCRNLILKECEDETHTLKMGTCVATLLWESVKMKLTLLKWELGSPPRPSKLQSSIAEVKTFRIWVTFISLKSYRSVDVENGLTWAIWTSTTHVMAKERPKVKLVV